MAGVNGQRVASHSKPRALPPRQLRREVKEQRFRFANVSSFAAILKYAAYTSYFIGYISNLHFRLPTALARRTPILIRRFGIRCFSLQAHWVSKLCWILFRHLLQRLLRLIFRLSLRRSILVGGFLQIRKDGRC